MSVEIFIGDVTKDFPNDPGGGVSYGGRTARILGGESIIIYTKCRWEDPFVAVLNDIGIEVRVLPSKESKITTFINTYDANGARKQEVLEKQEPITLDDLKEMQDIPDGATIIVAPVIDEVDMDLLPLLAKKGHVCMLPQGCFRDIDSYGKVKQKRWEGFSEILPQIDGLITVLSVEDITINGEADNELLVEIVRASEIVALTQGEGGVTIYKHGHEVCHTGAFILTKEEQKDFTGAGDVFATVFIMEMTRNDGDIKAASVAACFFAAIKIMAISGKGINSIPTVPQVNDFARAHSDRVEEYLQSEGVPTTALSYLNVLH